MLNIQCREGVRCADVGLKERVEAIDGETVGFAVELDVVLADAGNFPRIAPQVNALAAQTDPSARSSVQQPCV